MYLCRKNVIISDDGFTIEFDPRNRLVYDDGNCIVRLRHELLPSPISVGVWREPLPDGNAAQLSALNGGTIAEKVVRAMRAAGYEIVLLD